MPQELTLEQFETVFNNVSYSRGLYGKKPDTKFVIGDIVHICVNLREKWVA